jgi:hypothetical protein
VARSGELLLVCADGTAGVEELLGLVADVAAAGGDGSVLVRRVAALLASDFTGRYPACAVSGPTGDGRLAVLVHGSALATIVGADGEVRLSAADAITSVNRLVPGPISTVRLELPGAGPANPLARLEAGVITAAGVMFGDTDSPDRWAPDQASAPAIETGAREPEGAWSASSMVDNHAAPEWPPAPAPPVAYPFTMSPPTPPVEFDSGPPAQAPVFEAAPAFEAPPEAPHYDTPVFEPPADAVPVYEPPPPDAPALREPTDGSPFVSVTVGTGEVPPPPPPAVDARPVVLGLVCANGHLTDPGAEACLTCGTSMVGEPPELREGPRPPMGALLLDDGSTYVLDVDYVLGREPQQDPDVVAGTVRPLKITDAEGVVSRKHVRVALVGWDIQVIDLGSANGTYLQFPGEMQSHQLIAHQPVVVRPGTHVTMGRRWFRVEALAPQM